MKYIFNRNIFNSNKILIASIMITTFALMLCSCSKPREFNPNSFQPSDSTVEAVHKFDSKNKSEVLKYNRQRLANFKKRISDTKVKYEYDKLFNYEKAMRGVYADHSVKAHKYSALDNNNALTKEHLFEIVRKNNAEYLKKPTSLIKEVNDEITMKICEIIVDTTNDMLAMYPKIDKKRVYCNLGNLKIVEKTAAVDNAAVEPGMVLHINRNTAEMVDLLTSSNMYNVMVHEIMHILQFGCECENIKGCTRRCGIAHSYSNWEQDYADWTWIAEGSAERMTCLYAKQEPMTYQTYVNYLLSINLATMLQTKVPANYVETLYFYGDVDKLFSLFGADTEEEKQEIYRLIYSLEIMQVAPGDVKKAYEKKYGEEWTEAVREEVNRKVKRPIVKSLTKQFFANLAGAIEQNDVTKNDVLFLLNLYESTINYHLNLNDSGYDSYNAEFVKWYKSIRGEFFDVFENLSEADYKKYNAKKSNSSNKNNNQNKNTINAGMQWLKLGKQEFLIEKFEDNMCDFKV